MSQRIIQNERKRQQMNQKRKMKRRRLLTRNMILMTGMTLGIMGTIIYFGGKKGQQEGRDSFRTEWIETSADMQGTRQRIEEICKTEKTVEQEALACGNLVLVNNQNPIREYSDIGLVSVGDYLKGICKVKSTEIKLQKEAMEALAKMIADFNKIVGSNDLIVISGYRTFNEQEVLHYQSLQENQEKGENFVAKPDRSEHHTGLAVDFGLCYDNGLSSEYEGTGIYSWINENCYKYGFIVRYDEKKKEKTGISHEPWHFRYVGEVHAKLMKELDICLEEYIEFLKGYEYYVHPGQGITSETQNYSIYYVPNEGLMTHIPVPESKDYTISGNNKDGFIVTVNLLS